MSGLVPVVGLTVSLSLSRNVHFVIPGTCHPWNTTGVNIFFIPGVNIFFIPFTLFGKRNFTDMVTLRILRWEDYPDVVTRVLIGGKQGAWGE